MNFVWVYKTKFHSNGVFELHKAHLVSKGFSVWKVINYIETFSPVMKMNYVWPILSLATHFGWELHQMDVKSEFPHRDLTEESYMEQPLHFVIDSGLVCRLKNSFYSLKQAPHAWYENIDRFFVNIGFKCCESDHNIYVLHVHGDTLIVALYVGDLVITWNNVNLIFGMKKQLANTFEMTDLSLLHFFLCIQVLQMNDGIFHS